MCTFGRLQTDTAGPPAVSRRNGMPVRGLLTIAATIAVLAVSSCRLSEGTVAIWFCGQSPIDPTGGPEVPATAESSRQPNRVELAGAINESLSLTFAVQPGLSPIERPELVVGGFRSAGAWIDSSAVTIFRMLQVKTGVFPGWHIRSVPPEARVEAPFDVLVPIRAPRGGLPAIMQPGKTYRFWVDVAIPKGTSEGIYATQIELRSRGKTVGTLTVQLTVWPFVLPDDARLPVVTELDHRALFSHHVDFRGSPYTPAADDWADDPMRSELDALLSGTLRMLQGHGLTPVLPELTPAVKIGRMGDLVINWEQYDAVVEPCLNGRAFFNRAALPLWPLPTLAVLSGRGVKSGSLAPDLGELSEAYLAACVQHFDSEGWLDRSYALPPQGSALSVELAQKTPRFSDTARKADARTRVVSRWCPQDMAPYGWPDYANLDLPDEIDIWMPPAQFYDPEAMAQERAAGKQTWLAVDRPPYSGSVSIFASSPDVRVLTWQVRTLGAAVLHLGFANRWPDAALRPGPDDCVSADPGVLLYPGRAFGLTEPVPSARLKWLRRSMQDAAYCTLLERHGLGHISSSLRQSLAPRAGSDAYRTHFADGRAIGWVRQPALFDAARDIMAEALLSAIRPEGGQIQSKRLTKDATWRRFMLETRRLSLHVDGTRLRLAGPATRMAAEVECALTILNNGRAPVSGTAKFAELPQGWSSPNDGQEVEAIAPGGSRRVILVAHATVMPIRSEGHFYLPLEFVTDENERHRLDARVCYLAAEPALRPVKIDGDLGDWPPGSANVAADFVLITGERAAGDEESVTRPKRRTIAFVMRNDDYLYVAVNCETDATLSFGEPTTSLKTVVYDDLIPVGEDLIELLIDPLNSGTRSPSDLYHIVVKRSGPDLTEKGIRFEPPCGTHEPWPVDIKVAARTTPKRWTTELAIPLAAFGLLKDDQAIWGFTVTRYDAGRQEFSTWSGATRNAYDPLSLGNLHLP